jgi:hypothetical protein
VSRAGKGWVHTRWMTKENFDFGRNALQIAIYMVVPPF